MIFAKNIGYQTATQENINLRLGETYTQNVSLGEDGIALEGIEIVGVELAGAGWV